MKTAPPETHSPEGAALTYLMLETFRLNGCLLAAGDRLVRDIGLTSARWQVLGAIALAEAPQPVAHIARRMGLARQSVRRTVNELAAEGLVAFATNPHHKRAHLTLLTDKGRVAYAAASERQAPWASALAEGLSERQVGDALKVLRTLRQRLEAATPA